MTTADEFLVQQALAHAIEAIPGGDRRMIRLLNRMIGRKLAMHYRLQARAIVQGRKISCTKRGRLVIV